MPLVSVVMPVYNGEAFLAEAVESVLGQTFSDFELLLADDGSTDGSAAVIRAFAARDPRVRPLFLSHGGESRAANACVAEARGEYLARLDCDDVALPDRLAVQLDWMRAHDLDACGGCARVFGGGRGSLWFPADHEAVCRELLFRVAILNSTMMIRAGVARAHPYEPGLVACDYQLFTRLAPHHRLGNMPRLLAGYRYHARQTHHLQQETFMVDLRRYRRPYFFRLFPEATEEDHAAVERAAGPAPCETLAELEHTGRWLLRLAQADDPVLRQRMARRWWAACHRSGPLGWDAYRLYRELAPRFAAEIPAAAGRRLKITCALRLRPGSTAHRALLGLKHGGDALAARFGGRPHAAA